jgi:Protein of unknown function (DUF3800)
MGTPTLHLYLDDSGIPCPDRPGSINERERDYFAFGGIIIKSEEVADAKRAHESFTTRFSIDYPLHSYEIRNATENFSWLGTEISKRNAFYEALAAFIADVPGHATACVIHRPGYNARYRELYKQNGWRLCKTAYTVVVERAAKFAKRAGRALLVHVGRGGKLEYQLIRQYHCDIRQSGMYFDADRSGKYAPLSPQELRNIVIGKLNFVLKDHPMMQVADLLLYPVARGRYQPPYRPYQHLISSGRIIDTALDAGEAKTMGIKYSCFDGL